MVMAGALTTVWGVKTYMGVENTQEFATRMRSWVVTRMPGLSARLHRASAAEDHTATIANAPNLLDTAIVVDERTDAAEWSWPDAEKRLKMAFEQGGFSGWAEAVTQELEAESRVERRKRGHA